MIYAEIHEDKLKTIELCLKDKSIYDVRRNFLELLLELSKIDKDDCRHLDNIFFMYDIPLYDVSKFNTFIGSSIDLFKCCVQQYPSTLDTTEVSIKKLCETVQSLNLAIKYGNGGEYIIRSDDGVHKFLMSSNVFLKKEDCTPLFRKVFMDSLLERRMEDNRSNYVQLVLVCSILLCTAMSRTLDNLTSRTLNSWRVNPIEALKEETSK